MIIISIIIIPVDIKLSPSVDVFKSRLKTYLFRLADQLYLTSKGIIIIILNIIIIIVVI